jgi:hypothetical protein
MTTNRRKGRFILAPLLPGLLEAVALALFFVM